MKEAEIEVDRTLYKSLLAGKELERENDRLKKDLEIKISQHIEEAGLIVKLRKENEKLVEALIEISEKDGMTMLGECCPAKTCYPHFEPRSSCTHAYGVARGYSDCARVANEALKCST